MTKKTHFNYHFGIWEHLLNPIWVTEELIRPQKGPNIVLNGEFLPPYNMFGLFYTKANGFMTRWKKT